MAKKDNKHEIIIKIEGESWEKALDKAFKEEVKKVNVDGFRKGKVPRDIFEKRYGKERLYFPAVDYVIEEAYVKALEESKLIPVVQPKLEIKSVDESGVEIKFIITTKPEVNVPVVQPPSEEYRYNEAMTQQIINIINSNPSQFMISDGYTVVVDSSIIPLTNQFTFTEERVKNKILYKAGTIKVYAQDYYVGGQYLFTECYIM